VNKAKLLLTIFILNILLVGCKESYITQQNPFSGNDHAATKASSDVMMMQKGQNPMNRPSYEEYIESIETNPKQELFENYRQQSK